MTKWAVFDKHVPFYSFYLFTKQQNFGRDQIVSICRRQNKCNPNDAFCLDKVENIMGKGGNASNQHFLLFPQCFQKASFLGLLKVSILW